MMDFEDDDPGLVFAIPDFYRPSKWLLDIQQPSGLLFSQLRIEDLDKKLPDVVGQSKEQDVFFRIPDFSLGIEGVTPVPNISPELKSMPSIPQPVEEDDVDIWLFPQDLPLKIADYQSWDSFDNEKAKNLHSPYITEAGPAIFDAAVEATRDYLQVNNTGHKVVNARVYATSLLALALGRNSVLFAWDEGKHAFKPALAEMRISGYTSEALNSMLALFLDCGNLTKGLQAFVDKAYSKRRSPGQIALADAVSTLLRTTQSSLSEAASKCKSILQLQVLFKPAHAILTCFNRIVKSTSKTRSDESMLSTIFEEILLQEHKTDLTRDVLVEVLSRVSHPWLEFLGEWLGLQREAGLPLTTHGEGKSFVKVADREWIDEAGMELQERDFTLDYDKVPSFIAPEDARTIFEVGKSLRFLRTHHPEHPLSRAEVIASANPPSFEWKYSWQDIVSVEAKALQYEKDLTNAIHDFSIQPSTANDYALNRPTEESTFPLDFFGKPEEDMQAHVLASIDALNLPLYLDPAPDQLSLVLQKHLTSELEVPTSSESLFSPPVSLVPLLAFNPLIAAQARVINGMSMRMFFQSHGLHRHLSLQRNFHLLGNGLFSSRLSHALFDPDLESAERHRGVARSGGIMGLRLGGRDTWPPASSELRLALMGVLTESYTSDQPLAQAQKGTYLEKSLPGDLSFAVRDMSQEEIERCMNVDSIEALDFLRLSYKPPPPLEAVITPIILFKYDQLFKLLLRVLRMLYVVSALYQDATDRTSHWQNIGAVGNRFRIEAHHFITTLSSYFFDTGIECTWRIFERKLAEIEKCISSNSNNLTLGQNEGLDKLRDYHERVLDRIMFALFLRKRQKPVLQLLEEIFTLILQFSKISRERASLEVGKSDFEEKCKELYEKFKKKVGVFITVCRGLSEKKGYGDKKISSQVGQYGLFDGDNLADENTIAHLLGRLEMSSYYGEPQARR
ncbi:Spc98 family-domain-containing protein [Bisporella sp. PMI_857]|nr:Spc98 family-domain-containing protein [Bisporella sp. PMI_857]